MLPLHNGSLIGFGVPEQRFNVENRHSLASAPRRNEVMRLPVSRSLLSLHAEGQNTSVDRKQSLRGTKSSRLSKARRLTLSRAGAARFPHLFFKITVNPPKKK